MRQASQEEHDSHDWPMGDPARICLYSIDEVQRQKDTEFRKTASESRNRIQEWRVVFGGRTLGVMGSLALELANEMLESRSAKTLVKFHKIYYVNTGRNTLE